MREVGRQRLGLFGLLVLLFIAGVLLWMPATAQRQIDVRFDTTPSAPAANASAAPSAQPPSASVQLYDARVLVRAMEPAPRVASVPKPTQVVPRQEAPRPQGVDAPPPQPPQPRVLPRPAEPAKEPPPKVAQSPAAPPAPPDSRISPTVPAPAPPVSAGLKPGRYPPLVVGFETIGLERYARVTERIGGAFFIYLGDGGLGTRVSLAEQRIVAGPPSPDLAVERPYLVSDPAIGDRLSDLDLPVSASRSAVVMLWPRTLDARAWDAIEAALHDESIDGDQIVQVEAALTETFGRLTLRIEALTLKPEGRRHVLGRPRTVRITS